MEKAEIEKQKAFILAGVVEYVPNSIVLKTIIRKTTGKITAVSFDAGEILVEKISPFDTFIQVLEGKAEIVIDEMPHLLETGQSIIIPAHSRNTIKSGVRFKMLSTVIKSGYEEMA